jgi:hypothetical protein
MDGGVLKIVEGPSGTTTSAGSTGSTGGTMHGLLAHAAHMHGHSTLLGGTHTSEFANGHAGAAVMKPGAGVDSMGGNIFTQNLFAVHGNASPALLQNFVAGHDHLYLPGHSLAFTAQPHAITTLADKTMISMDGGKTMIALHGIHVSGDKH